MDYKNTLNLPTTTFPMKANLVEEEPKRIQKWGSSLFDRMAFNRRTSKEFVIHDGPPYANGPIHIGHALNKILKDFIAKVHYFDGMKINFRPGWDCHGLPIEQYVRNESDDLTTIELRKKCHTHAMKFFFLQTKQFRNLGIVANWTNPYLTLSPDYVVRTYKSFIDLIKNGLVCEKEKPVHWSWKAGTALAESEVEHQDHKSEAIYVAFRLKYTKPFKKYNLKGDPKLIVWTTTPWTLPSNVAVAMHPTTTYVLTKNGCIVSEIQHLELSQKGIIDEEIVSRFTANGLNKLLCLNPLSSIITKREKEKGNYESRIILDLIANPNEGTGCVHIAPNHGEEDYKVGSYHNLPNKEALVDDQGIFNDKATLLINTPIGLTSLSGTHVFEANKLIIQALKENHTCIHSEVITHRYPYCLRTKTPIIFRATRQWFVLTNKIKDYALSKLNDVVFVPEAAGNSMKKMVKERPDWCVSRQRCWGVPIALLRHKKTGHVLLNQQVIDATINILNFDSNNWYSLNVSEIIPKSLHERFNPLDFEKITDVLDVWYDSGNSWRIFPLQHFNLVEQPAADVYVEGRDQYRGWFSSSLFIASGLKHACPYKKLVVHGFTVDKNGVKMSKSDGNVISPEDISKRYGTEILRMWVALSDYTKDQRIGDDILNNMSEEYKKIRNTFRYLLMNLSDYKKSDNDLIGCGTAIDSWIATKSISVFEEVHNKFKEYNFSGGMHQLLDFIHTDLSGIYLNSIKDKLYCRDKNDKERQACQDILVALLQGLIGLLAPILTHTCDEVLSHAQQIGLFEVTESSTEFSIKKIIDIFDFEFINPRETVLFHYSQGMTFNEAHWKEALNKFNLLISELKAKGSIKGSLETTIQCRPIGGILSVFKREGMEDWFISSGCGPTQEGEPLGEFHVKEDVFIVKKSPHDKCPRCWKYTDSCANNICPRKQ